MSLQGFVWETIATGRKGPGPRSRHGLVYDQATRATVLFGGIVWVGDGQMRGDTWVLRDGHWRRDDSPGPSARHRGAMVYDGRRGVSVLFGGQRDDGKFLNDTWTYEFGRWRRHRSWFRRGPPPRCGHAMAFDEAVGEVVLFGGIESPGGGPLGDTWVRGSGHWELVRGPGPPARRYAAFAFAPDLGGCVLHGGTEDDLGRRSFGDAWLFRGGAWTRLSRHFHTAPRDDHGLAHHQAAGRLVMLGGLSGGSDILVGSPSGWESTVVDPPHPVHQCSPLAWDDQLGGLVMHGGETGQEGAQFDATRVLRLVEES